jgi:hypothetical protein
MITKAVDKKSADQQLKDYQDYVSETVIKRLSHTAIDDMMNIDQALTKAQIIEEIRSKIVVAKTAQQEDIMEILSSEFIMSIVGHDRFQFWDISEKTPKESKSYDITDWLQAKILNPKKELVGLELKTTEYSFDKLRQSQVSQMKKVNFRESNSINNHSHSNYTQGKSKSGKQKFMSSNSKVENSNSLKREREVVNCSKCTPKEKASPDYRAHATERHKDNYVPKEEFQRGQSAKPMRSAGKWNPTTQKKEG